MKTTKLITIMCGLTSFFLLLSTSAFAFDVEKLKAKILPADGSSEQAELCAATLMFEAYLVKDDTSVPNREAWSQHAMAGAHLWVPVAYKKSPQFSNEQGGEKHFVETVLVSDISDFRQIDPDTFSYYLNYCTGETGKLAKLLTSHSAP